MNQFVYPTDGLKERREAIARVVLILNVFSSRCFIVHFVTKRHFMPLYRTH